jgi:multisubunit Na+/H+ antiporter MnhE subunit
MFWEVVQAVSVLSYQLFPFIFLIAAIVWLVRKRNALSIVGLVGGLLIVVGMIVRRTVHKVEVVSMGGYSLPPADTNALVWLLFQYGVNIGLFLFSVAATVYFLKESAHNKRFENDAAKSSDASQA